MRLLNCFKIIKKLLSSAAGFVRIGLGINIFFTYLLLILKLYWMPALAVYFLVYKLERFRKTNLGWA